MPTPDAGPYIVEVEGEKQWRRRKDPGHALGAKVLHGAFLTADAEAQNLRHRNVELKLVGVVGIGLVVCHLALSLS